MNDETDENKYAVPNVVFLFGAFIPSVAGMICFKSKQPASELLTALLIINLISSTISAIGLTRGVEGKLVRILATAGLIVCFFILNVVITLFSGCVCAGISQNSH